MVRCVSARSDGLVVDTSHGRQGCDSWLYVDRNTDKAERAALCVCCAAQMAARAARLTPSPGSLSTSGGVARGVAVAAVSPCKCEGAARCQGSCRFRDQEHGIPTSENVNVLIVRGIALKIVCSTPAGFCDLGSGADPMGCCCFWRRAETAKRERRRSNGRTRPRRRGHTGSETGGGGVGDGSSQGLAVVVVTAAVLLAAGRCCTVCRLRCMSCDLSSTRSRDSSARRRSSSSGFQRR